MSSFKLPSSGPFPGVEIKLPSDLTSEQLLGFRPFNDWLSSLHESLSLQKQRAKHPFNHAPYKLRSINVQSTDYFAERRLGFVKLQAVITNDQNESLPGAIFMRGGSVAILIVISPSDSSSDEEFVLLAVQPRIAAASLSFVELPAGMIDDSGTFTGAAAKEIKEETGLGISEDELVDMTRLAIQDTSTQTQDGGVEAHLKVGVYPSPGACDEFIPIFLARKRMSEKEMAGLKGKLTGLRDRGEKITLKIAKLQDVWKIAARDGKTLAAVALYDGLKREGKL